MTIDSKEYLRDLSRQAMGESRRVLVTGGTGFVGSQLAQVLHDAGHQVTIMGRSRFRIRSDGEFFLGEISNEADVEVACREKEIVFHSAALTSPWGELEQHRETNLKGTELVVKACKKHGVKRLVHVSSTAIHFQFKDMDIDDNAPLPAEFSCPYAQSKAEAEAVVKDAIAAGLNGYIVRARAVFGPGDSALFPRLMAAAHQRRLRQIGRGTQEVDLTYIDNLLAGLILAANPNAPSGLCTITNQQPIRLWDLLHRVLKDLVPDYKPDKKISIFWAMHIAHLVEMRHRMFRLRGEPVLTRYTVGLLGHQQRFHSSAAKNELGYRPIVEMEEGVRRTVVAIKERLKTAPGSISVKVHCFSTGYIEVRRGLVDRSGARGKVRIHAMVALLEHPSQGPIVFDMGYSPRFRDATRSWPYRLYRWATKVNTHAAWSPAAWLQRSGYRAEDVKLVLLSHFHGDHTCGIRDFPNAEFVTLDRTWEEARDRKGFAALKRAILPELIPADFKDRLHTIKDMNFPGIGNLSCSHDLFRDGSIRLFELDGHAAGQMGALVQCENGKLKFLVADAFWTSAEIKQSLRPTLPFRLVAEDYGAALKTREALRQLSREYPEIEFLCTHCPELANQYCFDQKLEIALAEFENKPS